MNRFKLSYLAVVVALCDGAVPAKPAPNPFFALCMDTHDARKRSLAEQAQLLKELGYDGAGHVGLDNLQQRIQTLDAVGLRLFHVYVWLNLKPDAPQPYDSRLRQVLPQLQGRNVLLGVLVTGGKPSDEALDPRAVALLRELAQLSVLFGVNIGLYPHTGDWLQRVEDALRVAQKVDHPNVGVIFNLCHWLRTDPQRNYRPLLEAAGRRLFGVTINGADEFDPQPGWSRYIQPLDSGSFDVSRLLKTLRQLGYSGPIGLQCYGLGGDAREHLSRSMAAWRKLNSTP